MVRHQHVGVYGAVVALRALLQTVSIRETIFVGEKRGLPIVTALNYVVRHASDSIRAGAALLSSVSIYVA